MTDIPFWRTKTLKQMTSDEWESLCDGCAKCCLVKLQDDETEEIFYTNVACQFLDLKTCRCKDYNGRIELAEDCVELTPDRISEFSWLPSTCSYRLLAEGKDLPEWHPLVSGSADSVHRTHHSVKGRIFSEKNIHPDDLEDHIIRWVE